MTLTRNAPPMGNRAGPMKKPKKTFWARYARTLSEVSDKPVTLPKAPWETQSQKEESQ